MQSNTEIVREVYDAFARKDISAMLKNMDENIDWILPTGMPFEPRRKGPQDILKFLESVPLYYDEINAIPEVFQEIGDEVIVQGHHTGRVGEGTFKTRFAMFWTLKNGKITKFLEYSDAIPIIRLMDKKMAKV